MRRIPFVTVLVFCWLLGSRQATADTIFDNGGFSGDPGVFSDFSDGFQWAEDIALASGSNTIRSVAWWGTYNINPPVAMDDFTIQIFSDNGSGLPNEVPLFETELGHVMRVGTGVIDFVGDEISFYNANIGEVTLTPNQIFWVSIVNDIPKTGAEAGPAWVWKPTQQTGFGNLARLRRTNDTWENGVVNIHLAFQLNNVAIPEPSSLALVTLFVGGLFVYAWRCRARKARQSA